MQSWKSHQSFFATLTQWEQNIWSAFSNKHSNISKTQSYEFSYSLYSYMYPSNYTLDNTRVASWECMINELDCYAFWIWIEYATWPQLEKSGYYSVLLRLNAYLNDTSHNIKLVTKRGELWQRLDSRIALIMTRNCACRVSNRLIYTVGSVVGMSKLILLLSQLWEITN